MFERIVEIHDGGLFVGMSALYTDRFHYLPYLRLLLAVVVVHNLEKSCCKFVFQEWALVMSSCCRLEEYPLVREALGE